MFEKRHKKIEIQTNKTQDEQERDEFKTPEGTRRDGPPFPINLRTRVSKIHLHNPILERRREEQGGGEESARRRACCVWFTGKKEREKVAVNLS